LRNGQQSTINNEQSTINNEQSSINNQQSTIINQQSTGKPGVTVNAIRTDTACRVPAFCAVFIIVRADRPVGRT
jgi:hypothetical protein